MRRLLALASILIAALPLTTFAQSATPIASIDPTAWCMESGGTVVQRSPALNTNDPSNLLVLGGRVDFCEFTGGEGADPPTSQIAIDVVSLASSEPTMAVLAYLTKPSLPTGGTPGANPASLYCAHLGGVELSGTGASGGGWITEARGAELDVLQVCTFPDGSMIDSWGITYQTDGTIRGTDLTPLFGYQNDNPPQIFPTS